MGLNLIVAQKKVRFVLMYLILRISEDCKEKEMVCYLSASVFYKLTGPSIFYKFLDQFEYLRFKRFYGKFVISTRI